MGKRETFSPFDAAEYLKTDEEMAQYRSRPTMHFLHYGNSEDWEAAQLKNGIR